MNKHHTLILGRRPPTRALAQRYSVQTLADGTKGPIPPFVTEYSGTAILETFTILYDRDGEPAHGVAIAKTLNGARLMAKVLPGDCETLKALTNLDHTAVGMHGIVTPLSDSLLRWQIG